MKLRGLVVWLHGLGDTGAGWSFLEHELGLAEKVAFVFPTAPVQPVTVNGGMQMTSWMDLDQIPLRVPSADDEKTIRASTKIVHELLDKAIQEGTPPEKIILGGFSQGAALATFAGYTYKHKLAGICAFSGWPPLESELSKSLKEGANAQTPAFISHGALDEVVLPECGQRIAKVLEGAGVPFEAELSYPVAHGPHPRGLARLAEFITERIFVGE